METLRKDKKNNMWEQQGQHVAVVPLFCTDSEEHTMFFFCIPSLHIDHHFVQLVVFLFCQAVHGTTNVQADKLLTSSSAVIFKMQLRD